MTKREWHVFDDEGGSDAELTVAVCTVLKHARAVSRQQEKQGYAGSDAVIGLRRAIVALDKAEQQK